MSLTPRSTSEFGTTLTPRSHRNCAQQPPRNQLVFVVNEKGKPHSNRGDRIHAVNVEPESFTSPPLPRRVLGPVGRRPCSRTGCPRRGRVGQCCSNLAHRNTQDITGTVSMAVDPALRGANARLLGVTVWSGDEVLTGCDAVMMLLCERR